MNDVPTNLSKVYHNVVILEKGKLFGVLALSRTIDGTTIIGSADHTGVKNSLPNEGFWAAKKRFEESVAKSVDVGYKVVWRGFPHGRPTDICSRCDSVKSSHPDAKFCGHCGGEFHGS